jgi:hypothetical protein
MLRRIESFYVDSLSDLSAQDQLQLYQLLDRLKGALSKL